MTQETRYQPAVLSTLGPEAIAQIETEAEEALHQARAHHGHSSGEALVAEWYWLAACQARRVVTWRTRRPSRQAMVPAFQASLAPAS